MRLDLRRENASVACRQMVFETQKLDGVARRESKITGMTLRRVRA